MKSFRHLAAERRWFAGSDSLAALGRELDRAGCRRAVLFCGASLARSPATLEPLRQALGARCVGTYTGVAAHSPLPAVLEAAHALERMDADAVIALGGGSAVVTARAAAILLAEGPDAHRLSTVRDTSGTLRSPRLLAPKLPQFVLPTTPTTASVKAGSAVLDPSDGRRLAMFDPKTRARAVFVDPALALTPPRDLVVSASLNTLTMAVEGLLSRSGDAVSDALLMHAVRLLVRHLGALAEGQDDAAHRLELIAASLLCGHGTDFTGAGIAIPLGHAISARFHVDNGLTNAIVLPHVLRFNAPAAADGVAKLATALGQTDASAVEAVAERLLALHASLGVPARLRDLGVTHESLPALAVVSMDDWFVRDNPRAVRDAGELQQVLEDAW
jgi:alcohol dehydrogenase class IV